HATGGFVGGRTTGGSYRSIVALLAIRLPAVRPFGQADVAFRGPWPPRAEKLHGKLYSSRSAHRRSRARDLGSDGGAAAVGARTMRSCALKTCYEWDANVRLR